MVEKEDITIIEKHTYHMHNLALLPHPWLGLGGTPGKAKEQDPQTLAIFDNLTCKNSAGVELGWSMTTFSIFFAWGSKGVIEG